MQNEFQIHLVDLNLWVEPTLYTFMTGCGFHRGRLNTLKFGKFLKTF